MLLLIRLTLGLLRALVIFLVSELNNDLYDILIDDFRT